MTEESKNIAQPTTASSEANEAKEVVKKTKSRSKKGVSRQVPSGRAYIKSTYNNTIVTFTDQNGNVLSWSSAGQCGFKGPKKATPYAASIIVKDAFEKGEKCQGGKCILVKRNFPPGAHGANKKPQRLTNYGKQLLEKQKAKRIYG